MRVCWIEFLRRWLGYEDGQFCVWRRQNRNSEAVRRGRFDDRVAWRPKPMSYGDVSMRNREDRVS